MITFAPHGAIAGAIIRVLLGVGLGYGRSFSDNAVLDNPEQMVGWLLIVFPLMIAGVLAAMKVGELARMLVSGNCGGTIGETSALLMAVSGGKAGRAGAAKGGGT